MRGLCEFPIQNLTLVGMVDEVRIVLMGDE
jgi:hypothetical protein